ncbi:MAG: hypothetical protein ACRDQ4_22880 [Pseudonocardiaceae bacterium]
MSHILSQAARDELHTWLCADDGAALTEAIERGETYTLDLPGRGHRVVFTARRIMTLPLLHPHIGADVETAQSDWIMV